MGSWNLLAIVSVLTTLGVVKADSATYYEAERVIFDELFDQRHYDKSTAPRGEDGGALIVNHTITALRVDLNAKDQLLSLSMLETYFWTDDRLAFSGVKEDVDVSGLYVLPSEIWMPDVLPYNTLTQEPIHKDIRVIVDPNGQCSYIPTYNLKTFCAVDDHVKAGDRVNCTVVFASWVYDSSHLRLESTAMSFDELFKGKNHDWTLENLYEHFVDKTYHCCPGMAFREQHFDLELKRTNHI